jgi:predicted RNA-binding Zn ribbon-like protein
MASTSTAPTRSPLPPAPGADRHPALALANTLQTTPGGTADLIADRDLATDWLLTFRLIPEATPLGDPCTARLHTLRQDLRALFTAVTQGTPPPRRALTAVNHALTAAPTAELLAWDPERGLHRTTGHPLDRLTDHALALVAADAAALLTGPDADKLSACGAGHCSRFLLRTHASRQWCSVRCGDRVRAARAYSRRAGS